MPGFLGKFSEFPTSCLNFMLIFNKIFEISQMYGFSGSFPNAPNFFSGNSSDFSNSCWNLIMMYLLILEFPKCLGISEISKIPGYLGNFPNGWVSGKYPKCLFFGKFLRCPNFLFLNFSNAWVFGKFPKCQISLISGIWEISQMTRFLENSQMPGYLGNFPNDQVFGKFPIWIFLNFAVTPSP